MFLVWYIGWQIGFFCQGSDVLYFCLTWLKEDRAEVITSMFVISITVVFHLGLGTISVAMFAIILVFWGGFPGISFAICCAQ